MPLGYYFDHNVWRSIESGVRRRGVSVLTAFADGRSRESDPRILDRAAELGLALFTMDEDLLAEASLRRHRGELFAGVVYAKQRAYTIGRVVEDLVLVAEISEYSEIEGEVIFVPL